MYELQTRCTDCCRDPREHRLQSDLSSTLSLTGSGSSEHSNEIQGGYQPEDPHHRFAKQASSQNTYIMNCLDNNGRCQVTNTIKHLYLSRGYHSCPNITCTRNVFWIYAGLAVSYNAQGSSKLIANQSTFLFIQEQYTIRNSSSQSFSKSWSSLQLRELAVLELDV